MTLVALSRPWSNNSTGREKEEMAQLRDGIYAILESRNPMTTRQLFYQMVGARLIEKTEADYKNITVRLCGEMRDLEQRDLIPKRSR